MALASILTVAGHEDGSRRDHCTCGAGGGKGWHTSELHACCCVCMRIVFCAHEVGATGYVFQHACLAVAVGLTHTYAVWETAIRLAF